MIFTLKQIISQPSLQLYTSLPEKKQDQQDICNHCTCYLVQYLDANITNTHQYITAFTCIQELSGSVENENRWEPL